MRLQFFCRAICVPMFLWGIGCGDSDDKPLTGDLLEIEDTGGTGDAPEPVDDGEGSEDISQETDDTAETPDIETAVDTTEPPEDGATTEDTGGNADDVIEPEDIVETADTTEPPEDIATGEDTSSEDTVEPPEDTTEPPEDVFVEPDTSEIDPDDYPIPDTTDCHIEFRTRLNGVKYAQVSSNAPTINLTARAKNLTDVPLLIQIKDACPGGPAAFTGLPDFYDYYHTCAAGACAEPEAPAQFVILPYADTFADYPIAAAQLNVGGDSCNEALPTNPGQNSEYNITFTVELIGENPNVCYPGDSDGNGEPDDALLTVCPGVCPD